MRQSFKLYFSLLMLVLTVFVGCTTKPKPVGRIQQGDILFQNLQCGPLCDAIEAVTQGVDGKSFSHCALVVSVNDTLKVVEAIGSKVQVHSLNTFFARSGDTGVIRNITVERLKKSYRSLIPAAQAFALQQVGQPYDDDFILNNGKWYCSELIYAAFKYADQGKEFFPLAPMTFKDPKTHQFFPAWVEYYHQLGEPIPEGKPGTNPGLISRSPRLTVVPLRHLNLR
ncbi:MAG: hypothetical protein JXR71_04960 [Bacteroidales bacterium]|nr:hypothetical protein [Bacteroidales bacterium]